MNKIMFTTKYIVFTKFLFFSALFSSAAWGEEQGGLYWLDFFGRSIWKTDFDGKSSRKVAKTGRAPDGISFDPKENKIYWTNMGHPLGWGGGTIQRANIDGSAIETIVPKGVTQTPKQIQVDSISRKIYWCDREGAKVFRAELDGSNVEILASGAPLQEPVGIAIDAINELIYFTDGGIAHCS